MKMLDCGVQDFNAVMDDVASVVPHSLQNVSGFDE